MQLSIKHKFAFLCMPKCASTSIEYVLRDYCDVDIHNPPALKHININTYNQYVKSLYTNKLNFKKKIETFCLMRNPIDWVFSWYRYRSREALSNPSHPMHDRYTGKLSFEEFVNEMIKPNPARYARIGNQSNFFSIKGKKAVDRVFKLEEMNKVEKYLSSKLKIEIAIPKKNVSPKNNMQKVISVEVLSLLESHFEEDFRNYNLNTA
ncbi:MAG: sulfotransferase family 2 domain-containing protein [Fulvivirga sp.]